MAVAAPDPNLKLRRVVAISGVIEDSVPVEISQCALPGGDVRSSNNILESAVSISKEDIQFSFNVARHRQVRFPVPIQITDHDLSRPGMKGVNLGVKRHL